jgi:hypothetical protein
MPRVNDTAQNIRSRMALPTIQMTGRATQNGGSRVKPCAAQTTARDEGTVAPRAGSPTLHDVPPTGRREQRLRILNIIAWRISLSTSG